ncbi:hypothetical protein [uncultured Megasphaera sp.]|uniref:hypothetical protein n=1 Tax=uncultured Megasphaera sp. TaxID=165188 RepID=UPI002591D8E4|nr:hypothetical protein [uncultured Megasphaera sp.]
MQAYSEKVFDELYLNIDFGIGRLATYNVQNDFIENEDLAYKNWSQYICNSFKNDVFFYGEKTSVEEFILMSISSIDENVIQRWLNKLYLDNMEYNYVKIGLLHTLSHIEYKKVAPVAQSLALVGLTDPDDEVIEYSIKAFENWEDKDAISLLKGRQIKKIWLQKYLDDVVKYLEEL